MAEKVAIKGPVEKPGDELTDLASQLVSVNFGPATAEKRQVAIREPRLA